MTSKRVKADNSEAKRDAKRVKADNSVAVSCYVVVLDGETYIDVDALFKQPQFKAFFGGYGRPVGDMIEKEDLQLVYVKRTDVKQGRLVVKEKYSPANDARLVKKTVAFERILQSAQDRALPLAPPLITDEDLVFFTDNSGKKHQVEMRGTRTMEGILFRAKEVANVFKSQEFLKTIKRSHTAFEESVDYVWFALQKGDGHSEDIVDPDAKLDQIGTPQIPYRCKEIFLTSKGLVKSCFAQKKLNCSQPHGEIYLIHLGDHLYKFGKSWWIDQRVKTHEAFFKGVGYDDIEHVYSAKVDIDKLSAAEAAVKQFLQANDWYRSTRVSSELCELDDSDLEQVKGFYDQLQARNFSDSPYEPPFDVFKLLSELFTSLSADDEYETRRKTMEQLKMEHAAQLAEKDRRIAELEALVSCLRNTSETNLDVSIANCKI